MNDWLEAEQRVERAQQFSEAQRWAEALAELEVALSINPNNALWHAQRGYLLEELDRSGDAVEAYSASLELEPADGDVALALGVALARLGRFAQSLEVFDALAKRYPDFEPAYCNRIHVNAELGRHDQAEEMFYLAQELDDACPHCFYHMGASLAAREQLDRAIYCWEHVLELEPDYVGVNRRIAHAYHAKGCLEQAREFFLREVRDDPGNTDLLFELAELTLEMGHAATAAAKFEQILELDPRHPESRFALGKIHLRQGRPDQALACFEAVDLLTERDPALPEFDWRMGQALFQLGRFAESRARLEAAAAKDPDNRRILRSLADCHLASGRPAEAADGYRKALAIEGRDPISRHRLGICLAKLNRPAVALEHFLEAVRIQPDFAAALASAARTHAQLGQWRAARRMLRRAVLSNPGDAAMRRFHDHFWRFRMGYYLRRIFRRGALPTI